MCQRSLKFEAFKKTPSGLFQRVIITILFMWCRSAVITQLQLMDTNFTITLRQFILLEEIKDLTDSSVHWLAIKSKDKLIRMSTHRLDIFCMGGKMKLEDLGASWIHYHHFVSESHTDCTTFPYTSQFPPGGYFLDVIALSRMHKTNITPKPLFALLCLICTPPQLLFSSSVWAPHQSRHHRLPIPGFWSNTPFGPSPLSPDCSQFGAVTSPDAPLSLHLSPLTKHKCQFLHQRDEGSGAATAVKNLCDVRMPPFCLLFYS